MMHPGFVHGNNPVKHILYILYEILKEQTHSVNLFLILQFSGHLLCAHVVKLQMIMHYAVC
jgi:hypothetical protein